MDYLQMLLLALPLLLFGGVVIWIIIFLETYRHFPHMNKTQRIKFSIRGATEAALMMTAVILLFLFLVIMRVMK